MTRISNKQDPLRISLDRFVREAGSLVAGNPHFYATVNDRKIRIVRSGGPQSGSWSLPTEAVQRALLTTPAEHALTSLSSTTAVLEEIQKLPGWRELLPSVENRQTGFDEMLYLRDHLVAPFFRRYVDVANDSGYNREAFERVFAEFAEVLRSHTVREEALIPLAQLQWALKKDNLVLQDDLAIRRLTDADREAIINRGTFGVGSGTNELGAATLIGLTDAALDGRWRIPFHGTRMDSRTWDPAYDAITSLRLASSGAFSATGCYVRSALTRWYATGSGYVPLAYASKTEYTRYVLDERAAESTMRVFDAIRGLGPDDRAKVLLPLERFHRSFDVPRLEESVVDLVIALESLLVTSGSGSRHQLRMRLPIFISRDREKRLRLGKLVDAAYGMRSAIVHGGHQAPTPRGDFSKLPLHEFIAELTEAVRQVLRRAIVDASTNRRRIADIERYIDEDLIMGTSKTN